METVALRTGDDAGQLRQRKQVAERADDDYMPPRTRVDYTRVMLTVFCAGILSYAVFKICMGAAVFAFSPKTPANLWGTAIAGWMYMKSLCSRAAAKSAPQPNFAISTSQDGKEQFLSILVGVKESGSSAVSYVQKEILIPLTASAPTK